MKKKRWLWILLVLVVLLVGFAAIGLSPKKPAAASEAVLSLADHDAISIVDDGKTLTFCPLVPEQTKAIIFYPGALIDYRAYTPTMVQIAQAGVPVVVTKMPLNLAVLSANKADDILDAADFPCENEITEWYLGGHSLGGAMAAEYAANNLNKVTGLILWGSYPAGSADFTGTDLQVVSIYGSEDLLSSLEEVNASREQFPETAQFFAISGANHAQFGDYGLQNGDGEALITPAEQWRLVADLTLQFMDSPPQN